MSIQFETMNINKNRAVLYLQGTVRDNNDIVGEFKSYHEQEGYYEAFGKRQNLGSIDYLFYPNGSRLEGLPSGYKVSIPLDGRKKATLVADDEDVCTVDDAIMTKMFDRSLKKLVEDCRLWHKAFVNELKNHKSIKLE